MTTPLEALVAAHPRPTGGDKYDRGTVLVVGASESCPGAALLAGLAALRTGTGRVQLVVHPSACAAIGAALPEALVLGWDLEDGPPPTVADRASAAGAVVVGPGLDRDPGGALDRLVERCTGPVVLDAAALCAADRVPDAALVLAPNGAEAADLLGTDDDTPPAELAVALAERRGEAVAVRAATSVVADPTGATWDHAGPPCLGTAGSGDVLVGVLGGLLARGMPPLGALAWSVLLHAEAGRALDAQRSEGWLARDIADALPEALDRCDRITRSAPG